MSHNTEWWFNPQPESEPELTDNVKDFTKQILLWVKYRQGFYPEDIINMMIDAKLLGVNQFKSLKEEIYKSDLEPKIPTNHI